MINHHTELVASLKTIGIGVHYEMALTSKTATPCISYMEINNYSSATGDTLGYSIITYQVKVWANSIGEIQRYSLEVDKALKPLGFTRVSSGELYDNASTMIQKILTYECLAIENF